MEKSGEKHTCIQEKETITFDGMGKKIGVWEGGQK